MCFSKSERANKSKVISQGQEQPYPALQALALHPSSAKTSEKLLWMLNMTLSGCERNVQADFLQQGVENHAMFSTQVSVGATAEGPFPLECLKIIQWKWVASRMISAGQMLSDYHLVVPSACLHINKWAKTARLMTEGAVGFFRLCFLCLLHCSHMHYSLNGV